MKKFLLFFTLTSVLLSASASAQTIPTTSWADLADDSWYDASETIFDLSTAEQLAGLSALVENGNNFSGKTINLISDIDLGAHLFSPIGKSTVVTFSGTFDGNNHTLSNVFIETLAASFTGFFGQVTNATLRQIKFNTIYVRGTDNTASLAGGLLASSATDCHATGVDVLGLESNTGGLVGSLIGDSHILRCSINGDVSGFNQTGGLVGSPWDLASITESYATGSVVGYIYTGGLIGYSAFNFVPNRPITVDNCYANSDVLSTSNENIGGLFGGASGPLIIKNSYFTGTLDAMSSVGGIIGTVGNITAVNTYWNAESSGIISGVGQWQGPEMPGGMTPKTIAALKSDDMVALLNADQASGPWIIDSSLNEGYPTFGYALSVETPSLTSVDVKVYPTVFDSYVKIESKTATLTSYTLFTINGAVIKENKLQGTQAQIDASGISSGVYILQITTDEGEISRKVVKK